MCVNLDASAFWCLSTFTIYGSGVGEVCVCVSYLGLDEFKKKKHLNVNIDPGFVCVCWGVWGGT